MMMSDEMESYLSSIEEFVFDEKKIVTYSWLSRNLGIHVNLSKQLLHAFFESNKKKHELSVSYLVIGFRKNEESCHVLIVPNKDIEEVEKGLESISSKHVYSVQKSNEISNIDALYTAQKDEVGNSVQEGISSIKFNSQERDNTLLDTLKAKALPVPSNQPAPAKKSTLATVNKNKSPAKSSTAEQNKTTENDTNSDLKQDKKTSVVPSMFKNATAAKKKPADKNIGASKKPQEIKAFFNAKPNMNSQQKDDKTKGDKKNVDVKGEERLSPAKENKATLNICNDRSTPTEKGSPEKLATSKKVETKAKPKPKKNESKRGKTSKKAEKDQKKRKRLVVMSDSGSDSSEGEEEVQREPTPEPEAAVLSDEDIISATPEPSTKKRKRKLVTKTFTSDEGYMVTEKQYEDASCSDEEEEVAVPEKKVKTSPQKPEPSENVTKKVGKVSPKKKGNAAKKKLPSPSKTKQSSLMTFFKKK